MKGENRTSSTDFEFKPCFRSKLAKKKTTQQLLDCGSKIHHTPTHLIEALAVELPPALANAFLSGLNNYTARKLIALHGTALHSTVLQLFSTALHCSLLQCPALHCTALHCTYLKLDNLGVQHFAKDSHIAPEVLCTAPRPYSTL